MVVKPLDFVAKGRRGIVQPAVKCRGREYLRIIYGPEYTMPENLERLRSRGVPQHRPVSAALRKANHRTQIGVTGGSLHSRPGLYGTLMLALLVLAGCAPNTEEDARLVVFQTLLVMYEVHRAASRP